VDEVIMVRFWKRARSPH